MRHFTWQEVVGEGIVDLLAPYVKEGGKNLNYGCAGRPIHGWDNYDPNVPGLRRTELLSSPGYYDTVLACHVLEHIEGPRELMRAVLKMEELLKPGGHFIAICPHAQSREAFDSPFHVRYFTDCTWGYFTKKPYEVEATMGYRANEGMHIPDWELVNNILIVNPDYKDLPVEQIRTLWGGFRDTVGVFRKRSE